MDEIAIFRDGSSNAEFSASLNFVSPEEESVTCSIPGSRIFTADNGCVGGADGASECLASDKVTNSPTPAGSPAPTEEGETFKNRGPCPGQTSSNSSSSELLGYTSIEDLNADMKTEFKRVTTKGLTNSKYSYELSLCPGQVFNVSKAPIKPVLGDLTIVCGDPKTDDPDQKPCFIDGGVLDSTVDEYVITNILFKGLTFRNFTGVSIAAKASPPTVVTFQNSTWLVSIHTTVFCGICVCPFFDNVLAPLRILVSV
jgi:hypothetical protein